ncbi:hypothetical protein Q9233_017792 [Columba guinea]|nr:hypothetical protein Q9233_017792 [Columba guinea]
MPGVTVKDVNQQEFVRALAAFLKKSGKLKVPEWADTVKLAKHKELAPYDENWFYTRAGGYRGHQGGSRSAGGHLGADVTADITFGHVGFGLVDITVDPYDVTVDSH